MFEDIGREHSLSKESSCETQRWVVLQIDPLHVIFLKATAHPLETAFDLLLHQKDEAVVLSLRFLRRNAQSSATFSCAGGVHVGWG
jgi:hypothetical protein